MPIVEKVFITETLAEPADVSATLGKNKKASTQTGSWFTMVLDHITKTSTRRATRPDKFRRQHGAGPFRRGSRSY